MIKRSLILSANLDGDLIELVPVKAAYASGVEVYSPVREQNEEIAGYIIRIPEKKQEKAK